MKRQRWYIPVGLWLIFESIAVILWLTKEQVFYLFNFSYIGTVLAVGLLLFQRNYRYARHMVQLLVGLYMFVYLGLICGENMQIEGFWYYLFTLSLIHISSAPVPAPKPEKPAVPVDTAPVEKFLKDVFGAMGMEVTVAITQNPQEREMKDVYKRQTYLSTAKC